jgi:site-specific DNA recombinase
MKACPLKSGALVWAYCRDSGGEDQDIETQKRAVLDYIETNGLVLDRLFVDEARPGSSVVGRDAFELMIDLSRQGSPKVEGIVLWSFSRFARNQLDAQFYKADLRRRGFQIISMTDDLPGTDMDAIIEALYDWKHEQYLKDLSQNVKRTLHELARQGYSTGGFPPRGYMVEKTQIGVKRNGKPRYASKWVPDPEWAPKVLQAFRLRAEGASFAEIRDKTGLYRANNSVSCALRNKTYLGIRKCGDIETPGAHEPLVTQELWDKVQDTLWERPDPGERWPVGHMHPRRARSTYLLSGLMRCRHCGSAMIGAQDKLRSGNRFRFYICGKRKREGIAGCPTGKLSASMIDDRIMGLVTGRVLQPAHARALLDELNARISNRLPLVDNEIATTRKRLSDISRAISNLLDLAEVHGSEAALERLEERERQKDQLTMELRALEAQRAQSQLRISDEVLEDAVSEMRAAMLSATVREKRELLSGFVDRIEADRERASVWYTFPLFAQRGLYIMPPAEFESASPP